MVTHVCPSLCLAVFPCFFSHTHLYPFLFLSSYCIFFFDLLSHLLSSVNDITKCNIFKVLLTSHPLCLKSVEFTCFECVYGFYTRKNKPNPIKLLFNSVWSSTEIYIWFFFFPLSNPPLWSVVGLYRKKNFPVHCYVDIIVFITKTATTIEKVSTLVCGHKGHPLPRDVPYFLTSFHGKSVCNVFFNRGLCCKGSEVLMVELGFFQ